MEWLYVNRITIAIVTLLVSLFLFVQLHKVAVDWIYTEPTTEYNIMTGLTGNELVEAQALTESDNRFLNRFKGNTKTKVEDIYRAMERSEDYKEAKEDYKK